jgi:amino acid adenylation domain-containing protein
VATVHRLLAEAAEDDASRVAIRDRDRELDYEELEARANQVAHQLLSLGVSRGDRVALYLDKSAEAIVGLYGVMKAGAAYVPLDPQAPARRLGFVARDCGARCLVTGAAKAPHWGALIEAGAPFDHAVVVDTAPVGPEVDRRSAHGVHVHPPEEIGTQPRTSPPVRTIDADLAYILYTSGSTGHPKGVMLSHRNARAFVDWAARTFRVGPTDRLSSHAPLHFDLSVFDLFAASRAAAAVVLVPPQVSVFPREAVRFIEGEHLTVWYSVPSVLSMMVLRGGLTRGSLPELRTLLFAGEVFPTKYLRELVARLPHVRFANLYGPTETNVCTWYEVGVVDPDDDTDIPIGRPIDNDEIIVVDEDGAPVEPGEPGELYVRGATVMQGYWGDPGRTAGTRLPNPWQPEIGDPVYRTGDLVRELPDGNLRFLGRRDSQIKSRGYRIELGDIESVLHAHPAVVECAVVAVPDDLVTNRLRCHLVLQGGVGRSDLAAFCADRLPGYMVPEAFEVHQKLPRTTTGKIDRQLLRGSTTSRSRAPDKGSLS